MNQADSTQTEAAVNVKAGSASERAKSQGKACENTASRRHRRDAGDVFNLNGKNRRYSEVARLSRGTTQSLFPNADFQASQGR
jgi:hypothetical protein